MTTFIQIFIYMKDFKKAIWQVIILSIWINLAETIRWIAFSKPYFVSHTQNMNIGTTQRTIIFDNLVCMGDFSCTFDIHYFTKVFIFKSDFHYLVFSVFRGMDNAYQPKNCDFPNSVCDSCILFY